MEHFISLFVRSIFVDNMIFAFFLGMCFLSQDSQDIVRTRYCGHFRAPHYSSRRLLASDEGARQRCISRRR